MMLVAAASGIEVFGAVAGAIAVLVGAVVAINRLSGQGAESLGSAVHELSEAAKAQVVLMREDVKYAREAAVLLRERIVTLEGGMLGVKGQYEECIHDREALTLKVERLEADFAKAAPEVWGRREGEGNGN